MELKRYRDFPATNETLPGDVLVLSRMHEDGSTESVQIDYAAFVAGVIEEVNEARNKITQEFATRDDMLKAVNDTQQQMLDQLTAMVEQLAARKSVVLLPDVTVAAAALVTVTAGEKSFTVACQGVQPTDQLLIIPKTLPTNYGLRGYSIPAANSVTLRVQCPVLSVAAGPLVFGVSAVR